MDYIDLYGNRHREQGAQDRLLSRLYTAKPGQWIVRLLVHPGLSEIAGHFLDQRASRILIRPFIRMCKLDLSDYARRDPKEYRSYNDFFTREIAPGKRPADMDEMHLPSPCDGKVTAYRISDHLEFTVKNTRYTVPSLLKSKALARRYEGGYAIILRLCVEDYHRYIYPVSGKKSGNYVIPGVLHTVNPVAVERARVFQENSREFTLIKNKIFGTVLQMEVGALMVGRICNYEQAGFARRGEEKGRFEFGGSTIILLIPRDRMFIREDILKNTAQDCETQVRQGEMIGGAIEGQGNYGLSRKNT